VNGRPEFAGDLPVADLADEILTPGPGQVRGLLVWAGNPVLSTPNGSRLDEALQTLDLCVSVDYYLTETSRRAHYVLPPVGPLARHHYDVVFHLLAVRNTARFADPVVEPDGDLRHDWEIAHGLGSRLRRRRGASVRERLEHRVYAALGPVGMLDVGLRLGKRRLSVRGLRRAPHGVDLGPLRPCLLDRMPKDRVIDLAPAAYRADVGRLVAAMEGSPPELVLIGRRDLRSNNSWLHNAPRLMKDGARCALKVHPEDAARYGLVDGGRAEVRSRVGAIVVPVEVTDEVMAGVVSLPHGWGHDRDGVGWSVARANGGASVNDVTDQARVDELTGNAAFSGTPVEVRPLTA
jgi:anaerobic selenocysteine-containing dehydrogenase